MKYLEEVKYLYLNGQKSDDECECQLCSLERTVEYEPNRKEKKATNEKECTTFGDRLRVDRRKTRRKTCQKRTMDRDNTQQQKLTCWMYLILQLGCAAKDMMMNMWSNSCQVMDLGAVDVDGDTTGERGGATKGKRSAAIRKYLEKYWKVKRGLTIDSGAAEHVIPRGWVKFLKVMSSAGSRAGVQYVAANGQKIPNEGEVDFKFLTECGQRAKITMQVAKVNKPLASVSKLIDEGFKVIFDSSGSYMINKRSGGKISILRERGVFVLNAYVAEDPKTDEKEENSSQGFIRPR